jgi:isoleucyl-tRNA synthetase
MKYPEFKNLDYNRIAEDVLRFWKDEQIFEKSVSTREGKPAFVFYEGPPSANGTPGIHHVMARTIKDIFCRYKTLKGFQVKRKGGWDTHGLPIELQVEKELGIRKEDIGKKISVEEYNQKCREAVMKYTGQWNNLTEQMGYWVDLQDPYITYKNEYIESLWWLLRQLYDKSLLYKGYTIQPYSPAAGTGLSSHELNQPGTYRDIKDTSIVAQFKVIRNEKSAFLSPPTPLKGGFYNPETDRLEQNTEPPFREAGELFILAWTTTPWTLPANSALTVGKNITYVKVKTFNPYTFLPGEVILARDLVGKYFTDKAKEVAFEEYKPGDKLIPWQITGEFKGSDLIGVEYEQLMPYIKPSGSAFRVIPGDFVSTEDGTGIVHTSPTFGADDFRAASDAGIPPIMVKDENGKDVPIVDKQGRFVKEITDFAGQYVKSEYEKPEITSEPGYKSTDVLISIKLKEENKAFKVEKYEHSYPHCWRTDKPILYYPLDSWFIRTTAAKDKLVALNKTINWKPESTGTGRFGNWLENMVDWNLSRSRYWGTPLPIWRTEDGTEEVCIGSLKELVEMCESANEQMHEWVRDGKTEFEIFVGKNDTFIHAFAQSQLDLHRPFVDEIYLLSPKGKVMFREPDLIDVWFDSGAMPYAQWHYPFALPPVNSQTENQKPSPLGEGWEGLFPADFISEGVDQTRGWFYTLHAIAGLLFDSVAYKNVVSTGLVLDENGEKMSKSKGNVINPFETLKTYGPDATRWYMVVNAPPWDNLKFSLNGITEVQRKFFGTLFNTYTFFALYANLDDFVASEFDRVYYEKLTELDKWILSKLQSLILEAESAYENYDPTRATRAIQDFVTDQLSNWYVRLSRRRFWKGEMSEDKKAAYETLQQCLVVVAQLMSPVAPFFGDWLYQSMTAPMRETAVANQTPLAPGSVHLTDFVPSEPERINKNLEKSMEMAQQLSSLVHSLRKKHSLRVRQPLSRMLVPVLSAEIRKQIEPVEDLILAEVNIKKLEYVDDASGVLLKKIKPNFKSLGKKAGALLKDVAAAIGLFSQEDIASLEKNGRFQLQNPDFELLPEDVEILSEDIPGWVTASENGLTVALDLNLTEELREEGFARDVVNRVQNLRKDKGLEVQDKIRLTFESLDEFVKSALQNNREYICTETQAVELQTLEVVPQSVALDMDEFVLNVRLEVVGER